jgi:hypothetical protein
MGSKGNFYFTVEDLVFGTRTLEAISLFLNILPAESKVEKEVNRSLCSLPENMVY